FRHATLSGLSLGIGDLRGPAHKEEVLRATEAAVEKIQKRYEGGDLTPQDREARVLELWQQARDRITEGVLAALEEDAEGQPGFNPVHLMIRSGARGSREQVRQLAGMRGLISRPSGEVVETPIKSSFREGLSVLEYFRSTHGARKGPADIALKPAEAGYLTRKLADVAQNVVVTMHDCGTTEGVGKSAVERMGRVEQTLAEVICGRVLLAPVFHPVTGELLAEKSEPISREQAAAIEAAGIERVTVRSPMTCAAP